VPGSAEARGYHHAVRARLYDLGRRWGAAPGIAQDAFLYFASAVYALTTVATAAGGDYRSWGEMAAVAYALAAVLGAVAAGVARRGRLGPRALRVARRVLLVAVFVGALAIPLGAQLAWRAAARPGPHAQPEVAVIERAGDRLASSHDPYLASPRSVGVAPSSDARAVDESTFFPYLPGMVPFGLLNALHAPSPVTDARMSFLAFTLAVAAAALGLSGAPASQRGRALQFLVVLPSGALPLVTGGDDLPVLALMLLGLVLATRRHPVLAGLALGCAGALKLTAWPLLVLLGLVVRDATDRPARARYATAALGVLVPVLAAGLVPDPRAFLVNVVRFPLGLARVASPAASPMVGQVLANALPHERRLVTILLAVAVLAIVLGALARLRPRDPADVARLSALALSVATLLAPATRFGYFIYPVNLLVWSFFLRTVPERPALAAWPVLAQPRSSTARSRRESELVGPVPSPARAGLTRGLRGVTRTPASHS